MKNNGENGQNTDNIEIVLRLNQQQAQEVLKATELLLRLKLGQFKELAFNLLDISADDFCEKRDAAEAPLKSAADIFFKGKRPEEWKDNEWYRLYNLFQVLRKAVWASAGRDDKLSEIGASIFQFTEEPIPKCEIVHIQPADNQG